MANLGQIISEKSAADAQWQQQRQAERDKTTALAGRVLGRGGRRTVMGLPLSILRRSSAS